MPPDAVGGQNTVFAPACGGTERKLSSAKWYKFTSDGSNYIVDTCDGFNEFDTEVRVYNDAGGVDQSAGGGPSSPTCFQCTAGNRDSINGDSSAGGKCHNFGAETTSFATTAGWTYYVLVTSFSNALPVGRTRLSITPQTTLGRVTFPGSSPAYTVFGTLAPGVAATWTLVVSTRPSAGKSLTITPSAVGFVFTPPTLTWVAAVDSDGDLFFDDTETYVACACLIMSLFFQFQRAHCSLELKFKALQNTLFTNVLSIVPQLFLKLQGEWKRPARFRKCAKRRR